MTPKEKAKELVEKYIDTNINFPYVDTEDGYCIGNGYMTHNSSVKCALIAVDEIVKHKPREPMNYTDTIGYWKEVKREIEAL